MLSVYQLLDHRPPVAVGSKGRKMSPIPAIEDVLHTLLRRNDATPDNPADRPSDPNGLVLEAWGEFGSSAIGG